MRVILVGGGGHASDILSVYEVIAKSTGLPLPVVGIVDDREIDPRRFRHRGIEQLGGIDDLARIDATHYILAVGWPRTRKALDARVAPSGLAPATLIHPAANIPPGVPIGAGSVVLAGACLSAMAVVGRHVHVSHGAIIGHDCVLEDYAGVMPGAAVSGDTFLEEACLVGSQAVVLEGRRVGAEARVGAGAVVTRDVGPGITVVGNPARPVAHGE